MTPGDPPSPMRRALQAAREGLGRTGTNPLVGACLVQDGSVLATGSHRSFGEPHAEAVLLDEVESIPDGAELFCTLEPCIHPGKTPPCVERVFRSGVDRVAVAHEDPHPAVAGRGRVALESLGIEVRHPVERSAYRWLNRSYFYRQETNFPWMEAKLALSADGYLALPGGESQWITGPGSRDHGHRLRGRVDAVMIGAETLRSDDPRLTDRVTDSPGQPRAVVVSRRPDRLPLDSHLMTERAEQLLLVIPPGTGSDVLSRLERRGVTLLIGDLVEGRFRWEQVLPRLGHHRVDRVLVEGGGRLIGSLLEARMINEMHLFYSGRVFGRGRRSMHREEPFEDVSPTPDLDLLETRTFGRDVYVRRLWDDVIRERGFEWGFQPGDLEPSVLDS